MHIAPGGAGRELSTPVVTAVQALTHRPGENPNFYLNRILDDPVAATVKLAVAEDNLEPPRLCVLEPTRRRRIVDKNQYVRDRMLHHGLAASA